MFIISNRQMEDIIKYIEAWRETVDLKDQRDTRTHNAMRLSGLLLKRLKAKKAFGREDLSEGLKKYI